MTDKNLRDARLAQALQHMPDAHMQPDAQVRLAVLRHAQEAVAGGAAPAAKAPARLRRWWQPASPTAWGGALASVLVASFITLMWYGQPVPDANPDMTAPTAMPQSKPAEPPVTGLLKQDNPREPRKPAAPKAAELPPPPFIPPPEMKVQAEVAPPTAASDVQPAPPIGLLADAAPAARARAGVDISLPRVSAAPAPMTKARSEYIDIQSPGPSSGTVRRVPASQADALLAYLRDLQDQSTPTLQAAAQVAERTALVESDTAASPITIRTPQGEHWEIWPTQVRVQMTSALKSNAAAPQKVLAINFSQYEKLRSLVEQATGP